MDNENKIREVNINKDNVNLDIFLPFKLSIEEEKKKLYNLDDEFAKTKKNRDIFSTLLFILFILLISFSSLILIFQSQKSLKKLSVDIADFEDINILEILNTMRNYEDELARVRVDLEDLKKQRDREILDVKEDIKKRINYVNYTQKKNTKKRIDDINNLKKEEMKKIKRINDLYKEKIEEKEKEIKIIEEKFKIYDEEKLKIVQKEDILLAEDKIRNYQIKETENKYQKELKKETDYYKKRIERLEEYYKNLINEIIQKYNPIITDQNIINILNKDKDLFISYENKLKGDFSYPDKNIISDLKSMKEELELLQNQLQEIPFENSVPDFLKRINQLEKKIVNLYENVILELIEKKKSVEDELSYYKLLLKEYVNNFSDIGYIIDAKDNNDIYFILPDNINENIKINNGDVRRVIRNNYMPKETKSNIEEIGAVEFYYTSNNILKAKIKNIKENKNLTLFDIILLVE